jgi:hypothetical protein
MVSLAAQPANKRTHQTPSIEPIRLRSPMLARNGNAGRVNHVSLDLAAAEPARQPEAVAAGLEGDADAFDRMAGLPCLIAPTVKQG